MIRGAVPLCLRAKIHCVGQAVEVDERTIHNRQEYFAFEVDMQIKNSDKALCFR
jgi:hypothetical protein